MEREQGNTSSNNSQNVPKLVTDNKLQIQEAQSISRRIKYTYTHTSWYITPKQHKNQYVKKKKKQRENLEKGKKKKIRRGTRIGMNRVLIRNHASKRKK